MCHQEIEIKLDLIETKNYDRLIKYFNNISTTIRQENYFFDTADWKLSQKRWALRIRIEGNKATMTAKGLNKKGSEGLAVREEVEETIPIDTALEFIKSGISKSTLPECLIRLPNTDLSNEIFSLKLHFTNYRTRVDYKCGNLDLVLEIDKTKYPNGATDYELEIELTDEKYYHEVTDDISTLLKKLDIPMNFQEKSKYWRALLHLNVADG